jgi:hypothetical protein
MYLASTLTVTVPSTLGLPPSIDGDISHADDPMELDDPE